MKIRISTALFEKKEEKISKEAALEAMLSNEVIVDKAPVDRVLYALGFGTAWVSDISKVSDFPLENEDLEKASQELGVEVGFSDYIYQIAQRLRDNES